MQNRLMEQDLYEKDIYAACHPLEKAGWRYDQNGSSYQEKDGIRYRSRNGHLKPLSFKMAVPQDNRAAMLLTEQIHDSFKQLRSLSFL